MPSPLSVSALLKAKQTQEIVEYIARTRPEEERSAFKQPFADAFKQAEGQKPIAEDEGRRQQVISQVVDALNGLGEGSDRGTPSFTLLNLCL